MEHLAVLGVVIDTEMNNDLTLLESELFPVKMRVSFVPYSD